MTLIGLTGLPTFYPRHILAEIASWQAAQAAVRVLYGGNTLGQTGTSNVIGSNATGRTFIMSEEITSVRQDGLIRQIKARLATSTANPNNTFQIKVFRPSGSDYEFVAESEFLSTATGGSYADVTINLATPLPCKPGDRLGVWIKGLGGNACIMAVNSAGSCGWIAGNLASSVAAGSLTTVASARLCLSGHGVPPLLVGTGDSIMEGHNSASQWHSHYHTGPAGNLEASPLQQLRNIVPTLETQNFAQGSTRWDTTLTKIADIDAAQSWGVIAHVGVNDVSAGRSWASIEAEMDAFKAGLTHGQRLFIDEVLPWSNGNDTQAAAVRALNANYAAWCAANDAALIKCHNALGQLRVSTGELDDLRSGFDYDGVHLTEPAGVLALARRIAAGIEASI